MNEEIFSIFFFILFTLIFLSNTIKALNPGKITFFKFCTDTILITNSLLWMGREKKEKNNMRRAFFFKISGFIIVCHGLVFKNIPLCRIKKNANYHDPFFFSWEEQEVGVKL